MKFKKRILSLVCAVLMIGNFSTVSAVSSNCIITDSNATATLVSLTEKMVALDKSSEETVVTLNAEGGKGYLVDFDDLPLGSVSSGWCDNDYGYCETREIVAYGKGNEVHLEKALTDVDTDAWFQKTFTESFGGEYAVEFSARQTVDRIKTFKIYNSTNGIIANLSFGYSTGSNNINGTSFALENNLDGNYHHYKLLVNETAKTIKFFYDGNEIEGTFTTSVTDMKMTKFRVGVGGKVTEGEKNGVYLDNIRIYETDDPIPSAPVFTVNDDQTLTITSIEGTSVLYSTDGSFPSVSYTGPIAITEAGTVKAIAKTESGLRSSCGWIGPFEHRKGLTATAQTSGKYEYKIAEAVGYSLCGEFSVKFRMLIDEIGFTVMPIGSTRDMFKFQVSADGTLAVDGRTLNRTVEKGKWHDVELVVNTDKSVLGVNIDGETACAKGDSTKTGFAIRDSVMNCAQFLLGEGVKDKSVWIDDVEIKSYSGISDFADVGEIRLISNGSESVGLNGTNENLSVEVDLRVNGENDVCMFAAIYDADGKLSYISTKSTKGVESGSKSDTYTLELNQQNTADKTLKCYIWSENSLWSIDGGVFLNKNKRVDGSVFGIHANTGKDVTKKLQKTIDSLPEGTTLVLENGDYIISPLVGKKYCLEISGKKNIVIDGSNSRFIINSYLGGFAAISGAEGTELKNMSISYSKRPWEQAEVTSINKAGAYFDIHVDNPEGFLDTKTFKDTAGGCFITLRDSANPKLQKSGANDHYLISSAESLENENYRLYVGTSNFSYSGLMGENGKLEQGDKIVVTGRGTSGSTFYISGSDNVKITNVTAYESGECGVKAVAMRGDLVLDGFNMRIEESSGNWISSNADGVHAQFSRGKLVMQNCNIEGLSDDCVNLYQSPLNVSSVSENELVLASIGNAVVGDTVVVFNQSGGVFRGEAKISEISGTTIVLDSTISTAQSGDSVYIKEGMFVGSEIKNNIFSYSRRYGLLLKCHNIDIIGNRFEKLGSDAITAQYSTAEGLNLENACIQSNTITNCGYLPNGQKETSAAISIKSPSTPTGEYLHKNIDVSQNTITGTVRGLYLNAIDGLTCEGNVFENCTEDTNITNCR